jgi:hypothetical protein
MSKRVPSSPPAPKYQPEATQKMPAAPRATGGSGRVKFDSRGQAVWEWAVRTGFFDRNASTQRVRALTEGPVKLELEQTLGALPRRGAQAGAGKAAPSFNPYESNKPSPAAPPPRAKPASGNDPYSRGPAPAPQPESVNFTPDEPPSRRKP